MFSVVNEEEPLQMQKSWDFAANHGGNAYLQNRA